MTCLSLEPRLGTNSGALNFTILRLWYLKTMQQTDRATRSNRLLSMTVSNRSRSGHASPRDTAYAIYAGRQFRWNAAPHLLNSRRRT
jgi:hypothetical protein